MQQLRSKGLEMLTQEQGYRALGGTDHSLLVPVPCNHPGPVLSGQAEVGLHPEQQWWGQALAGGRHETLQRRAVGKPCSHEAGRMSPGAITRGSIVRRATCCTHDLCIGHVISARGLCTHLLSRPPLVLARLEAPTCPLVLPRVLSRVSRHGAGALALHPRLAPGLASSPAHPTALQGESQASCCLARARQAERCWRWCTLQPTLAFMAI